MSEVVIGGRGLRELNIDVMELRDQNSLSARRGIK
jgi:hypothetical protein